MYPAGGSRATSFEVTAGGQNLATVTDVYVTGEGVRATIVRYEGNVPRLNGDQRRELRERLMELRADLLVGTGTGPRPSRSQDSRFGKVAGDTTKELPDLPVLRNPEKLTLKDLDRVEARFLGNDPRRQPNAQIGEAVRIEVTIDAGATPGDREIRLGTRIGLTNPVRFQVGALPEIAEDESAGLRPAVIPLVEPPLVLNGQVLPGDVDRMRIRATAGQRLLIQANARRLIPYLADAVPGWFQAAMSLRDPQGVEIAFSDHFRFDPDPILFCEIPRDGDYLLEITDSIHRGREDFIYRVSISENPFITSVFPLGGRAGVETIAAIAGWNVADAALRLDTRAGTDGVRWAWALLAAGASNAVPYTVDSLPECQESDADDFAGDEQRVTLPRIVNGRIALPGDVDVFRFDGHTGQEVVAAVEARNLGSPLDSLLRLTDASGRVIAWNDDHEDEGAGILTHHADSYVRARLPAAGVYRVEVSDAQRHGGVEFAYRLRLSAPRPGFGAIVTPSSINVPAGRCVPVTVHALREDGFDGDIDVSLVDAPAGFALSGARLPRGRSSVRMTLTAPPAPFDRPLAFKLSARARLGGKDVVHDVMPAQDMMQAFLYRHLVTSQSLMVAVLGGGGNPATLDLPAGGRVRIPAGGSARVRFAMPRRAQRLDMSFQLSDPPAGVTLGEPMPVRGGVQLEILTSRPQAQAGYEDNLIVEAYLDPPADPAGLRDKSKRSPLGYLPAIPIEITRP